MFEVTKAEDDVQFNSGISSGSPSSSPNHNVPASKSPSALRVTVPTELQGVSYIMVLCQKGKFNLLKKNKYNFYILFTNCKLFSLYSIKKILTNY